MISPSNPAKRAGATDLTKRLLIGHKLRNTQLGIEVPLKVLYSPFRHMVSSAVDYTRSIRRASPRGVVTVDIPEYVVGHRWEQLRHNQSAFRIKNRLLSQPGVVIASVPYQLSSSRPARDDEDEMERRF